MDTIPDEDPFMQPEITGDPAPLPQRGPRKPPSSPFLKALQRWEHAESAFGMLADVPLSWLLDLPVADLLAEVLTHFPPFPPGMTDAALVQQTRQEVLTAWLLLALGRVVPGLVAGLARCESPSEETILYSLLFVAEVYGCQVLVRTPEQDYPWGCGQGAPLLVIAPQTTIADTYRADFLIEASGVDLERQQWPTISLLVECDGHAYHSTKEQIARDKARDRSLQAAGYAVLRFTGSEIWGDPLACAEEVLSFVLRRSRSGLEPDKGAKG